MQTVYKVVQPTGFLTLQDHTIQTQFSCTVSQCTARENSRRFATPSMVSPGNFASTNRKPYPDLGSDTWFFTRHYAGNQRLRRTMLAVFTGYWVYRPQWLAWVESTRMTETQSVAELKYILLAEVLHPMKRKETDNEGPCLWLWSL